MSAGPLVSVVIDNYNYAQYLAQAVESALAQTYPDTEIIVVDDGSTDDSRRVLDGFGARIRTVYQDNAGQAAAFNAGFAASRGEVIAFLDADDAWRPAKVERVLAALEAHPRAGWLRHRMAMVDSGGRSVEGVRLPAFRGTSVVEQHPLLVIEGRYPVLTSCMVLRRAVAERIFPMPTRVPAPGAGEPVSLRYDADAYVAFAAAALGVPFLSLDEVLGAYRRHDRQQFVGAPDIGRMVQRQIDLAGAMAGVFAQRLRRHVVPSTVHKLTAIQAALAGEPIWSRRRVAPLLAGLRRALALAGASPLVALRQAAALAFAFGAPRLWAYKLLRTCGYPHPALPAPTRRRRSSQPA
jgi:hypothetical protein